MKKNPVNVNEDEEKPHLVTRIAIPQSNSTSTLGERLIQAAREGREMVKKTP